MTSDVRPARPERAWLSILAIGGFLNVAAPVEATAQSGSPSDETAPAASSFSELTTRVERGQRVRLTDMNGRTSTGTIGQLSASTLELMKAERGPRGRAVILVPEVIAERDVQSIEATNSPAEGILIGLALGGLGGALAGVANCGNYSCDGGSLGLALGALGAGIGAGLGALIDAGGTRRTVLYEAPRRGSSALYVSPVVRKSSVGALVSVRF